MDNFISILKDRFDANMKRHPNIDWSSVEKSLHNNNKIKSLYAMETTGGEPDVVGYVSDTGEFVFFDCSEQSPAGRRSYCYDDEALNSRKAHKPENSVIELAKTMGIEVLDEEQYKFLQTLGEFDTKTSSWLRSPPEIRSLGGAIFGDRRFGRVFIYHNGAESYYAVRGFRASIRL